MAGWQRRCLQTFPSSLWETLGSQVPKKGTRLTQREPRDGREQAVVNQQPKQQITITQQSEGVGRPWVGSLEKIQADLYNATWSDPDPLPHLWPWKWVLASLSPTVPQPWSWSMPTWTDAHEDQMWLIYLCYSSPGELRQSQRKGWWEKKKAEFIAIQFLPPPPPERRLMIYINFCRSKTVLFHAHLWLWAKICTQYARIDSDLILNYMITSFFFFK